MLGHTPEERRKARELANRMQAIYGDGWRDLVIAGPLGSFRLGDVFAESGLIDPEKVPVVASRSHGLWQVASGVPTGTMPPVPMVGDALARLRETAAAVRDPRVAPWSEAGDPMLIPLVGDPPRVRVAPLPRAQTPRFTDVPVEPVSGWRRVLARIWHAVWWS